MLPKMSACGRDFDETKYISFLRKNGELLGTFDKLSNKVSNTIKKGFDSEPIYNEMYPINKIKSYEGKICANFRSDKIPKVSCQCIFLSAPLIEFV